MRAGNTGWPSPLGLVFPALSGPLLSGEYHALTVAVAAEDLGSGAWAERNAELLGLENIGLGARPLIAAVQPPA